MLYYRLGSSQKIGGHNKTFEIDEGKFGRRKYNWGHKVKGQWMFGGVERELGNTFLVLVPNRTDTSCREFFKLLKILPLSAQYIYILTVNGCS